MKINHLIIILFITFCSSLSGCGGGGGGGGGGSAPVTNNNWPLENGNSDLSWNSSTNSATISSYQTSEYQAQYGLDKINAAEAYALLQSNGKAIGGDGIKIGITDSGVSSTHQEISANYNNSGHSNNPAPNALDSEGDKRHGTHVASIAAGVKDGNGMHGVAFNAKIISVHIVGDYRDINAGVGIEWAANSGAKVVNMSWGYSDLNGLPIFAENTTNDVNYLDIKSDLSSEFASAVTNDVFMAAATGNDSDTTHVSMPALFAQDSITNGQMIAVGAVNSGNVIASFSNRCKQAKNFCLVASGVIINGALYSGNTSYVDMSGTSMATPQVAGAAAVLRAAWPYLTAKQTATILLETATDLGAAGVDDIYGRGLLNLENAVTAQGPYNISSSSVVLSSGYDARNSSITTNPIFGNSYSKNLAPILKNAVFFDEYGRDYKANLDRKILANKNSDYNLDNLLFTNYSSTSLPINFGENYSNQLEVKFVSRNIFSDPISGELKHNKYGLKYLTIDKSREDESGFNASDVAFLYSKNFNQGLKIGFSKNDFNNDFNLDNPAKNYNLISYNNFISNPYSKLGLTNFSRDNGHQTNSNQLNISQKLGQNLKVNLSYSSYNQSHEIGNSKNDQSRIFDSGFSYNLNNKTKLSFNFGNLKELDNNLLGSKSLGAFSLGNDPKTKYVNFNLTRNLLDNWKLTTSYSEGKTDVSGNNLGIFREFSDIKSRGFAIGFLNDNFLNGKFGLVYSQPLRIYSGTTKIDIPVSRDADGNVQRMVVDNISLKPDGKEQNLEFSYALQLENNGALNFNSIVRRQANNVRSAKDQYLLMARYAKEF